MKYIKNTAILGVVLLLLSHNAWAEKKDTPPTLEGTTKVNAEEVIDLIGKLDDLVIVDARKTSDREKGWIEGSVGLPNTDTTAESLAKVAADKSMPILFYCNGVKCGRSYSSAKKALNFGYKRIYWFRGGMEEWENKGFPVVK